MSDDMIIFLVAVLVHFGTCYMGWEWGNIRGRGVEGLILTLLFSVLGLIAIAVAPIDEVELGIRRLDKK